MRQFVVGIRNACPFACLVTAVVIALNSTACATSGWDSYLLEISNGYQIHGKAGMLTVRRENSDIIVEMNDTNNEPIVGFADTDKLLFLCAVPNLNIDSNTMLWETPYPFEGAKIWVLEKDNSNLLGPLDEVGLSIYCDQNRVLPGVWSSTSTLSERAIEEKQGFAVFLGLISSPYLLVIIIFALLLGAFFWHLRTDKMKR